MKLPYVNEFNVAKMWGRDRAENDYLLPGVQQTVHEEPEVPPPTIVQTVLCRWISCRAMGVMSFTQQTVVLPPVTP